MKAILICFILFIHTICNAQYTNLNWAFGDSAGIKFSSTGIDSMYRTAVKGRGSCASISDSAGNLIFYASTPHYQLYITGAQGPLGKGVLFNANNQIIENGDSLNSRGWYRELVILPWPEHYKQFYVFKTGVTMFDLNYSQVDMNLNQGSGKCTQKNILIDTGLICDGLSAIKHGNGRDYWLLYRKYDMANNNYYRMLVTASGVSQPMIQSIGSPVYASANRIIPSPDGNSIMCITNTGLITQLDFDRCTGLLSNEREYHSGSVVIPQFEFWDGAFSPDGEVFYSTSGDSTFYLYQFDLTQPVSSVFNTRVVLDSIDSINYAGTAIRLAPDNKIYTSTWWFDGFHSPYPYPDSLYNAVNTHLGKIEYPDSIGTACNYQPLSVYLGGARTYIGLPNNPDYTLGKLINSPCDTITAVNEISSLLNYQITISPNPASEHIIIHSISSAENDKLNLNIYNASGAEMESLKDIGSIQSINCSKWNSGIYILKFRDKNGTTGYIKMMKED